MAFFDIELRLFDLIICLSDAADLVSKTLVNHHKQTAHFARHIAKELGLSAKSLLDVTLAGMIHDLGALAIYESLDQMLEESEEELDQHALISHEFLSSFEPLDNIAKIIRYHHTHWRQSKEDSEVPQEAHVLSLADYISRNLRDDKPVLEQVDKIMGCVRELSGDAFMPEAVGALNKCAYSESFWFDSMSPNLGALLRRNARSATIELDIHSAVTMSRIFARIIDSRSRFTATHSAGVAATACTLAELVGFAERERLMMDIAGNLHDLGKLAVPSSILEKPGRLTKQEMDVIKCHTYYTYRILETIRGFETINVWASFHHERLDGKGYPFRVPCKDLTLGSRILAVADVYTALTENRPYREGMPVDKAVSIINKMAETGALDPSLVLILRNNSDTVDAARLLGQENHAGIPRTGRQVL